MKNPNVDAEFVLAHQGYVQRLARSLVFDDAGAEDLAQQVWLAALEHPPVHRDGLRGWLASIARNLASLARRGEARRSQREQGSARPEAIAAADELLVREASRAKLVQAVLALDEPFRETLILRYFDELSPRAIAAKQGVPLATVKSRLKRGLATLRERLDREGGGRAAWSLALIHGMHLGPGVAQIATFSAKSFATGVALMTATKKVLLAAVIVVAGFLAWRFGVPAAEVNGNLATALAPEQTAGVEPPVVTDKPDAVASERVPQPNVLLGKRVVPPPAVGHGPGDLDVKVELKKGHVPLADVTVSVSPLYSGGMFGPGGNATRLHLAALRTDADGIAHFKALAPGDVEIEIDRGYECFGLVASGTTRSVTLEIEDACSVSGRVVDASAQPVAGAEIWLADLHEVASAFRVAESGEDGHFALAGIKPSTVKVFAVKSGHASSARKFVRVNEGEEFQVELALRGTGAALEGTVRDALGQPLSGALIVVGPRIQREISASGPMSKLIEGMPVNTDELGHFALEGLLPGPSTIEATAVGFPEVRECLDLAAGTRGHHDVVLTHGATLRGVIQRADGTLASEAVVTVRDLASGESQQTASDEKGAYRLEGLASGAVRVQAKAWENQSLEAELVVKANEDLTWNARLETGLDLSVRVLDEQGKPAKKITVRVDSKVEGREPFAAVASDAKDGMFLLRGCPDAACVVTVYPSDSRLFPLAKVGEVHPGGPPVVIRIERGTRPSVHLIGKVVGPDGAALSGVKLTPMNSELNWAVGHLAEKNGSFRLGPFPAGAWGIQVECDGLVPFHAKERELAADATWDLGTIQLAKGDPIEVELVYPDEPQHFPPGITVDGLDSGVGVWCKIEGNRGRTPPLAPGRYDLRLEGAYAACRQTTEVIAGRENKVTLVLQHGIRFDVRLVGAQAGVKTKIEVRDSANQVVLERSPPLERTEPFQFPNCLTAGHYRIEVADAKGRKRTLEIDVDAALAGNTIDVQLE